MRAGAVADHAHIVFTDSIEYLSTHTVHFTHTVADQRNQCQIVFYFYFAERIQFSQYSLVQYRTSTGLATGLIQRDGNADFRGCDQVDRNTVLRQNREYLSQETTGMKHVRAVQGQQDLIAAQCDSTE